MFVNRCICVSYTERTRYVSRLQTEINRIIRGTSQLQMEQIQLRKADVAIVARNQTFLPFVPSERSSTTIYNNVYSVLVPRASS